MSAPEPPQYTGWKEFEEGSSLSYFRGRPTFARRMRWPVLLTLAGCAAWLVAEGAVAGWRGYTAGPVSRQRTVGGEGNSHARFEGDCSTCHTRPLGTLLRCVWPASRATPDSACTRCHEQTDRAKLSSRSRTVDGLECAAAPPHAPGAAADPGCAICHREHRGKARLADVADGHCVSCHASLRRADGAETSLRNVTGFAGDRHPEVRWPGDAGTVRFNHRLHCGEGVADESGAVKALACGECHAPTEDGKQFRPISYAAHCARCHPLRVGVWASGEEAARFRREPLAHGQPPSGVRASLKQRLDALARSRPEVWRADRARGTDRPLPAGRVPRLAPVVTSPKGWIAREAARIEAALFGRADGCRFCHAEKTPWSEPALPAYEKSTIPSRWLRRAVFDHAKHRIAEGKAIDCVRCHDATATASRAVMMPGIGTCQECHRPAGVAPGACLNCHRYHDSRREHASHRPGGE